MSEKSAISPARGGLAAAAAFTVWGLLPIYWKALGQVPALEILCHRVVWSLAVTAAVLLAAGRFHEVARAMAERRTRQLLLLSSLLISANWLTYIWAVNAERVLETSLGYYITPMVNAALGMAFLRERPTRLQLAAMACAAAGVVNLVVFYGAFPWVALVLAFSFGSYGLTRKVAVVAPVPGLFFETLVASVPAGAYLVWLAASGSGAFGAAGVDISLLLVGAGAVTTLPLVLFAFGARNLRLTTVGIFQFIAPTLFFLLGAFVYHEPFTGAHLATFVLIWGGVAVYTVDSRLAARRSRRIAG